MKAPDVTYVWCHKAPFERLKRELPREVWGYGPPRNFKKESCFQLFWKPSNSFLGKAGVHSNSL